MTEDINRRHGQYNATDLWYASKDGDYPRCQSLVNRGADVNIPDGYHITPLWRAAWNGDLDMCKLLVDHGADINILSKSGQSPLTIAAHYRHYEVCKYLMLQAPNVDYSKVGKFYGDLLCLLSHHGDMVLIQKLVQNLPQADINMKNHDGKTAINEAAEQEQYGVWNYLLQQGANINAPNGDGLTSLYFVSKNGRFNLIKKLVEEYGADVQAKGCLSVAAEQEQYDVLDYLLNQGATWEDINKPIKDKLTPLYFVCRSGNIEWVEKFVKDLKADINGQGCLQVSVEFYHFEIAEFLIKSGCSVDQYHSGITSLMMAAKTSSAESVELLLENGANPDLLSEKNDKQNALSFALKTGNQKIISLLSEVTTQGMESCIKVLAESSLTVGKEVKVILEKIIHEGKKNILLQEASVFGNGHMANFLLNELGFKWAKSVLKEALKNSILSDNFYFCKIVKEYCEKIGVDTKTEDLENLIMKRGRTKIVELFNIDNVEIISPKYEDILDKFPKTDEFPYVNIMDNILPLVLEADPANRRLVTYNDLVAKLQTPPIHPKGNNCPEDCRQKPVCRRIRDTIEVLEKVVQEAAKIYPIFKETVPVIVGSLKEGANIGDVDETDILLILDEKKSEDLKKLIIFDKTDQKLKVRKFYWEEKRKRWTKTELELPKKLEPFVTQDEMKESGKEHYHGYINEAKYFFTFMDQFHKIISSGKVKLPKGMKLSTTFVPCEVCKDTTFTRHQYVRCRHEPMCPEHQKKLTDEKYEEQCECKIFNSPALTYSKIWLAMHPQFEENGQLYHLDVDVNPPTLPVGKLQMVEGYESDECFRADQWVDSRVYDVKDEPDFDGSNTDKGNWILTQREKMAGWKTEYDKTLDNSAAAGVNDGLPRPVRLRCYNMKDVIVEQCLLFYKEDKTLAGNKIMVYVVTKILRKCTNTDITSFKMKFAVDRSLDAKKYEDAPIGQSLKRVLRYWTMAGKFTGVHPELAEIGVKEVRVTDQGLEFIGDVKPKEE